MISIQAYNERDLPERRSVESRPGFGVQLRFPADPCGAFRGHFKPSTINQQLQRLVFSVTELTQPMIEFLNGYQLLKVFDLKIVKGRFGRCKQGLPSKLTISPAALKYLSIDIGPIL